MWFVRTFEWQVCAGLQDLNIYRNMTKKRKSKPDMMRNFTSAHRIYLLYFPEILL